MRKIKGYNRHVQGDVSDKRPCKKIQRFGKAKTLSQRVKMELQALMKYRKRVHQTID